MNSLLVFGTIIIAIVAIIAIIAITRPSKKEGEEPADAGAASVNTFVTAKNVGREGVKLRYNPYELSGNEPDTANTSGLVRGDDPEADREVTLLEEFVNPETTANRKLQIAAVLKDSIPYMSQQIPALIAAAQAENLEMANSKSVKEEMAAEDAEAVRVRQGGEP